MNFRVGAVVAVLLLAGACGDDSSPSKTDEPDPSPSASATTTSGPFDLAPGRIGPVEVGMTLEEAEKTGAVERTEPDPDAPCPPPALRWKAPNTDKLDLHDADGKIVSIGAKSPEFKTPEGIGVGSTLEEVEQAWPGAKIRQSPAFGSLIDRTDGNKWMSFAFVEEGKELKPSSKVVYLEATIDEKPVAFPDGC